MRDRSGFPEGRAFLKLGVAWLAAGIVLTLTRGEWSGLTGLGVVFSVSGLATMVLDPTRTSA